ncbi:MAG: DUF3037 domain-containing protein [Terriglobales bacterium]
MAEKRQFELLLVRLVPHALRDDFMTVGVVVLEPEGDPGEKRADRGPRFADLRIIQDWKRVECFAPDLEVAVFGHLEATVREQLNEIRGRDELVQLLESRFGAIFDVAPAKAMVAGDPAAEMRLLERDYLSPMAAPTRALERARRIGRLGIAGRMRDAFTEAGVVEMLTRDLDMREFTGENDPFRVDFGFRVGRSLKMFHALALNMSREPAVTLAYRYSKIQVGMRSRGDEPLMTAIISEDAVRVKGELASGVAMLRANEILVRDVAEMGEIAEETRRELMA